jgi:hypothetical protein
VADTGTVRDRLFAEQGRDFRGLVFGAISPTDIDGFLDFGNKVFVFIEAKYGQTPIAGGQRLALERLNDATEESGRRSIVLIAEHYTPTTQQIDMAQARTRTYYTRRRWYTPACVATVRQVIDLFLRAKPHEDSSRRCLVFPTSVPRVAGAEPEPDWPLPGTGLLF